MTLSAKLIVFAILCVGVVMYLKNRKTTPEGISRDYTSRKKMFSRIRIEKPKGEALMLAEVQAFSPLDVNVARLGIATQSSTKFEMPASNAINGRTGGRYAAGHPNITHTDGSMDNDNFWQVVFREPSELNSIKVFNRTDASTWKLEGSKLLGFDEYSNVILEETLTAALEQEFYPNSGEVGDLLNWPPNI